MINTLFTQGALTWSPSCWILDGSVKSLGNNIADPEGYSGNNLCKVNHPTDIQTFDPIIDVALKNNGGPTPTHALLAGSIAVDGGNTEIAPRIDQRGISRPQGAAADVGAFELVAE